MRKASRIYKRKSRSNLETLIILIGAIIILSVAFYLAREKSYIPPETQVVQKIEKETSAAEDISAEKTTPEMSPVEKQEEELVTPVLTKEITPEQVIIEEEESMANLPAVPPEKTATSETKTGDSEKVMNDEKRYTIQIGAFSSEKNAISLADEIKNKGYKTFIVKGANLYKVQVEEFKTYSEAEKVVPKIKALGCPTFITTR